MIGSSPLLAGLGSGETDMGCEKKIARRLRRQRMENGGFFIAYCFCLRTKPTAKCKEIKS
jgi:hypothetical protein